MIPLADFEFLQCFRGGLKWEQSGNERDIHHVFYSRTHTTLLIYTILALCNVLIGAFLQKNSVKHQGSHEQLVFLSSFILADLN